GDVERVTLVQGAGVAPAGGTPPPPVKAHYLTDNATAMEVPLPQPVGPGESVTLDLEFGLPLPQKQGRWGQWKGAPFLAQWLPVVAYYDDNGWQPVPFVPWHQPFFNEAGVWAARVTLPAGQKLAATGAVLGTKDIGDGWQQVDITPTP